LATNEALTLDSLALNDGTTYTLEALDMTPPPELEEWIKGADSNGALLAREPLVDNRTITATIRIEPQATKDLALAKIAAILDKLKECQRNANGLALTWVPADATTSAITFRCLSGQITDMPIDIVSGWFVKAPLITLKLTCLPFGEGTETSASAVTSTDPIVTTELSNVAGDVPALGRLVVTDNATQARRYVAWGLENRWYPTSSPPSLIIDSTAMTSSGYAGSTTTRTGAYSGATNNVLAAVIGPTTQAICSLGNRSHVGTFRVMLRVWIGAWTNVGPNIRLSYQVNDSPFRALPFRQIIRAGGGATEGWNMVDLGEIRIPTAILGTQRWTGRIESYTDDSGAISVEVDAVWLVPAERYGRARGTYVYNPGVVGGRDSFTGITAATALNARAAPAGGAWATSGVATDFAALDGPGSGDETMGRSTASDASPRYAILGSTNYTDTEVGVSFYAGSAFGIDTAVYKGVIARWVDSSNYAAARVLANHTFQLVVIVSGSIVASGTAAGLTLSSNTWYGLRIIAYTSGLVIGHLLDSAGTILESRQAYHSSLATSGALDDGKPGFLDQHNSSVARTRYYDDFYAATPPAEPIVVNSTRTIQFRHDSTLRFDSTNTYAGPPPEYVGARFLVPPAGGAARKTRVAVIARRNDVMLSADDSIADSTTIQAFWTPRWLVVPRV
jgi:hypothetical protein